MAATTLDSICLDVGAMTASLGTNYSHSDVSIVPKHKREVTKIIRTLPGKLRNQPCPCRCGRKAKHCPRANP